MTTARKLAQTKTPRRGTRRIRGIGMLCIVLIVLLAHPRATPAASPADGFAHHAFGTLWSQTDGMVESDACQHAWIWGAHVGEPRYERYLTETGSTRLVQYFDKARMEQATPADPNADTLPVTTGKLVMEMVRGELQSGSQHTTPRPPAHIPIAGDLHNNPAPTYAMLAPIASLDGNNKAPIRLGEQVQHAYINGHIEPHTHQPAPATTLVHYDATTGHNLPQVFAACIQQIAQSVQQTTPAARNALDAEAIFGLPITEPYWTIATIGGVEQAVLFQAFERRILTYTPANPYPWQIEMGNVGQHYFQWRYGRPMHYAQPPQPGGVSVYETALELLTYDYEPALVPTSPDDDVFPYPRIDHAQVGPPRMQSYRAIVVENRFVKLTFLPELGGRLYQATIKASGQPLFYQNPVITPSYFGQRGWWLGVGGLEWAVPTQEHGYLEYLPWDTTLQRSPAGNLTITHSILEQQRNLQVAGTVNLAPDEARFSVALAATNTSQQPQPLQMWSNALLTPGHSNQIGKSFRFVVPTDTMIVHATQDPHLPGAGETIAWPHMQERDLSYPANWQGYLGAFAPQPIPFIGGYDSQQDVGAAIIHQAGTSGGKIFGFSQQFDRSLYTDDESDYVELWSGAQPTFWDNPPLAAGDTRSLTTTWLPLWGLGELVTASADGALGMTQRSDGGTSLTIAVARILPETEVIIWLDGQESFRSLPLTLRPDQPLTIDLPVTITSSTHVQVEAGELRF